MTRELILLAAFAALMSAAPYWFLPARRRAFALSDAATWIALGGALASLPALKIWIQPSLLLAIVLAAKLVHFFLWCALVPAEEVRWSPRAAALFALAVFLIAGTEALGWPVDGDEPYYVVMAESLLRDGDLDLANQYADPGASVTKRLDLGPQLMDPVGPNGERYARHEPLLALLLVPGVASLGLWGAMATMALFGALAVGSMVALALQAGASRAAVLRAWPLVGFAPPLLFYSIRIWPEAPAALALSEAIRAAGNRKYARAAVWLVALSLLQLRFVAIAATFAIVLVAADRGARKLAGAIVAMLAIPLLVAWLVVGDPLSVHQWSELAPAPPWKYLRGAVGILFDAQAGLLFQAPVWFAGLLAAFAVLRSPFSAARAADRRPENEERRTGLALTAAAAAAVPYLILLLPRDEWHGGWSPPLRYLVVFAPLAAVGAARLLERSRGWLAPAAIWTAGLALHGVAFPWRLFHIANGESLLGEWLSIRWGSDFSRLLPSAIRPNGAAWAAGIVFAVMAVIAVLRHQYGRAGERFGVRREAPLSSLPFEKAALRAALQSGSVDGRTDSPYTAGAFVASILIVLFFAAGLRPGNVVQFEDAHVDHREGLLDPELWTVARFRFTGGWRLGDGESLSFRMRPGRATIHVRAEHGGTFALNGEPHAVPPTGADFIAIPVGVTGERSSIRVISGPMTFDRIERER